MPAMSANTTYTSLVDSFGEETANQIVREERQRTEATYLAAVETVAERVRELADEIVQKAAKRLHTATDDVTWNGSYDDAVFVGGAQAAWKTLNWGIANLHIDGILGDAVKADAARNLVRELETEEDSF